MITAPATAQDFTKWARQAKTLSIESLRYVIKDCKDAENAMRGWNPEREGFYADQCMTFQSELIARLKGKP
jgi:hypothetical protein